MMWAVDATWRVLLDDHPDLDEIVTLPRSQWNAQIGRPRHWLRLATSVRNWAMELRELRPDLVLDFHGNLRSGLAGRGSGAPVRVGYSGHQQKEGNRLFTTHRVSPGPRRLSRLERNLKLVRSLGLPCSPVPAAGLVIHAELDDRARIVVEQTVGVDRPFAVLSPGASRAQSYKRPPTALLAAAVRAAAERGLPTLVVYGPGEQPDAERVAKAEPRDAFLAPPTDLRILAAVIRRARLFVGGDTGPMHLACAVGTTVVGIYGPTDPVVNAPWGVEHRAVFPPECSYTGIKKRDRVAGRFEEILPEAVTEAVLDVLA
jgi:ADP-heptose:LPS heptosyltransferase